MVQCGKCNKWEQSICRGFLKISGEDQYEHECYKCTLMQVVPESQVSQEKGK